MLTIFPNLLIASTVVIFFMFGISIHENIHVLKTKLGKYDKVLLSIHIVNVYVCKCIFMSYRYVDAEIVMQNINLPWMTLK